MSNATTRPSTFNDYVGQSAAINNLKIFVASAKARNTAMDHVLFTGPPGLGKTSIANVLANEIGSHLKVINATTLKNKGDLIAVLSSLEKKDILFIDEIHALSLKIEEVLYTAMEDFQIDVVANGNTIRVDLEPFTLIGATTVSGKISRPLLDRFGEVIQMEPYSESEIASIVVNAIQKMELAIDPEAASEIAKRSRGTPRLAHRFVRRVRDFALAVGTNFINSDLVKKVSQNLGIDEAGLDKTSVSYMLVLAKSNKPMGVKTIASSINQDEATVIEVIEPYLIQSGFVSKTFSGRFLTDEGKRYIS